MTGGILDELDALVSVGGGHETTEPSVPVTYRPGAAPKGWEAGYKVADDGSWQVTTAATELNVQRDEGAWVGLVESLGMTVPEGWTVRLVEAKYDPGAWGRDEQFVEWPDAEERAAAGKSRYTKSAATRQPVWRYRFAVEPSRQKLHDADVSAIFSEVMRRRRQRPKPIEAKRRSLNVLYSDPQAGKVAMLGGTEQLVGRFRDCLDMLDDHVRDLKALGRPATEAAWLDGGDCVEGFNNVTSQKYTNDLLMTQQIRVHRRLTYHGLDYLARTFPRVLAATCGSNHAQLREGKDPVGPPNDDWGLEVMSQVQDGYSRNPDAYGHVRFVYPDPWRDTVALDLGGLPVGLAHGHQFTGGKAVEWWKGQIFGNQPVTDTRILVTNHLHHFAAKECGDGRLWIQGTTLDNGSDWFTRMSGEVSLPGIVVFSTTEDGWDDLRILRPDAPEVPTLKAL